MLYSNSMLCAWYNVWSRYFLFYNAVYLHPGEGFLFKQQTNQEPNQLKGKSGSGICLVWYRVWTFIGEHKKLLSWLFLADSTKMLYVGMLRAYLISGPSVPVEHWLKNDEHPPLTLAWFLLSRLQAIIIWSSLKLNKSEQNKSELNWTKQNKSELN